MEKSAGFILFREKKGKKEYLLLKYCYRTYYWSFPKGWVEKGESEEETALRETSEETGLKKIEIVPSFKEKVSYFLKREKKTIYKEVVFFLGKILDKEEGKVSWEHEELKWFPYEEALKMLKFKRDKELLMKAKKRLQKI